MNSYEKNMHILFIDNYDSFTYNLVDDLLKLNYAVTVYRNDVSLDLIDRFVAQHPKTVLVLSPGPGHPAEAGKLVAIVNRFKGKLPMLGICLGHQAIALSYGAQVTQTDVIVHGKASTIQLESHTIFSDLPKNLRIARYHSLVVSELPSELKAIAHFEEIIMSFVDDHHRIVGFQFHPESILSTQGYQLLQQTIHWLQQHF
ncbi:MAG: aminodeoxychorismate/anthranilate synthase component II [Pseudomonadota bacterium]